MKQQYFRHMLVFSFVVLLLVVCSKEETETGGKEAIIQVELSFSENHASYSWTMGFQLVSNSDHVLVSGHSWDETIHPVQLTTWLTVTDEIITSSRYELTTTDKVTAVTFNGTAELRDDSESLEPLTVTAMIYADGKLIKTETAVFSPEGHNYLTVIVGSEDF